MATADAHSHAAAAIARMRGCPVIQEILGHSNISTTMNVYSHVLPSLFDDASEAIGRALGG
jgi:integrase